MIMSVYVLITRWPSHGMVPKSSLAHGDHGHWSPLIDLTLTTKIELLNSPRTTTLTVLVAIFDPHTTNRLTCWPREHGSPRSSGWVTLMWTVFYLLAQANRGAQAPVVEWLTWQKVELYNSPRKTTIQVLMATFNSCAINKLALWLCEHRLPCPSDRVILHDKSWVPRLTANTSLHISRPSCSCTAQWPHVN